MLATKPVGQEAELITQDEISGSNPYIFGDAVTDRFRLETQATLVTSRLKEHAPSFIGDNITSILDCGCGEGQLGRALLELYPDARLVGIDRDEKAIAKAISVAQERGLKNCEYLVGDIQQQLPTGPFDLIFDSNTLVHTQEPQRVVELSYQQLAPAGHYWLIEAGPGLKTAFNNPAYLRLGEILYATMTAIGSHPLISEALPAMLEQTGFHNIRTETDYYAMGGPTKEGQATLGVMLGVFYNARQVMSRVSGISQHEIEQLYADAVNAALLHGSEIGRHPNVNILAQR
jgi:SAM-dependent methyltransferase